MRTALGIALLVRGGEMPAFLDEQIELMRRMLREAGVSAR